MAATDDYRMMLSDVADNLEADDAMDLAQTLNIKPARRAKIRNGRNLINEMEKIKFVSKDNTDDLLKLLKNKQLTEAAEVVEKYKLGRMEPVDAPSQPPIVDDAKPPETDSGHRRNTDDSYSMTQNPRGHCLLLTYQNFHAGGISDRKGNEFDRANLRKLFGEMLKFKVHDKHDLTLKQTQEVIEEIAKEDHWDCFVCIVCSHGEQSSFKTSDGNNMDIETLIGHFKPDKCPGLAGKPKIFFLNFCLGGDDQTYTLVSDGIDQVSKLCAKEADFLITYSTLPGFKALRSTSEGTIYVQNLYKCFKEFYKNEHLIEILTRVRKAMDDQMKSVNFKTKEGEICCQVSESHDRLFKKVYFPPV